PWPPDAYFNFVGNGIGGRDWYRGAVVAVESGANKSLAWELDFDGYAESVFEEDPYNFIEV
ncbi:MAG: hypothetical protein WBC22_16875, partial [Sedimentisphaerales bacterium]